MINEPTIWIINPDNYYPGMRPHHKRAGAQRMDVFAEAGLPQRVVHACDVVATLTDRPRLWVQDEDFLDRPRVNALRVAVRPGDRATLPRRQPHHPYSDSLLLTHPDAG